MALQPFGPNNRQEDRSVLARMLIELHKVQPLILIVATAALALGVKMVWPGEQIAGLTVRVAALEKTSEETQRTLRVLADAKCVELTEEQLAIAQIDCSQVFDRVRIRRTAVSPNRR